MTSHTEPVELRESGGVHVYYVLPIRDDEAFGYGVFEHVSTHMNQDYAEYQIAELETADKHRQELAADARKAITTWHDAGIDGSDDDYHTAAEEVAGALDALLAALQKSSLI